ncbi:MAG: nucleoside recognition domain-containing protein [Syntrophomonadaceae bacterium]|nr:nucleoside recognition domain-containing protein [Syntrophomonadaceae bacterium]
MKVVLPVYIIVTLLNYTPVISSLSKLLTPLMQLAGLPGEAALPLVLAGLVSSYAGIGAVIPLGFDVKELTIICAMIMIAHDLPVETAVNKKTGSPVIPLLVTRISLAFLVGIIINLIM